MKFFLIIGLFLFPAISSAYQKDQPAEPAVEKEESHGIYELSAAYSFQKSSYNAGSYTRTIAWNGGIGYYFTQESEMEFSYQDSTTNDVTPGVQNITYRDRVYSLNLLYHMAPPEAPFKPYVRLGVGQLNRDATGTYQGGYQPAGRMDQVTVIGGLGLKMRIYGRFALKAEATTYLAGGNISTWQDNLAMSFGGSFYF